MSYIKRYLEDELERISAETGFSWDTLMDAYLELSLDGAVDIQYIETLAKQNHPALKRIEQSLKKGVKDEHGSNG